jgi:signal transduction histidine kinase
VLVLLGAAMYFFMLYNFRQKLKVQSIRYRLAADLHDEVGATLSSIAMATNMVQRKIGSAQADVHSLLAHIKADSEETIHIIRDTVWAINPDNDSPQKLFEKMRSLAFQMLTTQNIALAFDNQVLFNKRLKINMEQRRNLYLIFKEAINNIAKHSEATKVYVCITRSAAGLHWLIEDNGVGFDTHQQTDGNGLKSFRSRASESFIDLTLESAPGNGTRLVMVVLEV